MRHCRSLLSKRPKYLYVSSQITPCLSDEIIMYLFFLHISSAIAMGIVQYLQVMLFVFNLNLSTEAQKKVTCQNFKFAIDDDVIHNQILEGHVFERLTVPNVIQCHLKCKDDCLKLLKVLRFKKHSLNLGDLIHERQSLIKFIAAAVSLRFDILRHLALHSTNCNRHTFNQQLLVRVFFFISVPFANISPSIVTWAMKRNPHLS